MIGQYWDNLQDILSWLFIFLAFVLSVSKTSYIDGCIGGVTTISGPLIITSLITAVNPISTLFASCAPISSIPSSISPSSSQRSSVSSFTPTTFLVTTTPLPTVITQKASSTLDNGVVTVITVISTSTPPPSVVALSTSIAPTPSQSQGSKSSIAIAPIVGGAVGGFSFLIVVVVLIWFLLCVFVTLFRVSSHRDLYLEESVADRLRTTGTTTSCSPTPLPETEATPSIWT